MTTMNRRHFSALAGANARTVAAGPAAPRPGPKSGCISRSPWRVPVTKDHRRICRQFREGEPGIKIKPIYAGDYVQTITKVLTAIKGGDTPETAILLAADLFTLYDEDVIVPIDNFVKTDPTRSGWPRSNPAFMENARVDGKTYAIPIQRSTPVLYYNKDAFKAAGLDPNKVRRTGPRCARWPRS